MVGFLGVVLEVLEVVDFEVEDFDVPFVEEELDLVVVVGFFVVEDLEVVDDLVEVVDLVEVDDCEREEEDGRGVAVAGGSSFAAKLSFDFLRFSGLVHLEGSETQSSR